jgi:CheY-like chemotaxis protein
VKQLQILLVEDNEADVFLVQQSLEEHKLWHELHVLNDGGKAIEYVTSVGKSENCPCPDIMLLDLNLLTADGATILGEFRKQPACVTTPVIIVTSSDAPKDRARAAELGISYYFTKPSDLDEFMTLGAVIKSVLEEHARGEDRPRNQKSAAHRDQSDG